MRLVIVGFGYSARAIAQALGPIQHLSVTARSLEKVATLRAEGFDAVRFDGKVVEPAFGQALLNATHVLMSAPPDEAGDPLINAAEDILMRAENLEAIAYLSTVGVYGDHHGAWVDEESALKPVSLRSRQRVAAEQAWQQLAHAKAINLGIFRLSGIYGPGRSALENLKAGTARRIIKPGQVFNRIHVGDIGAAVAAGLQQPEKLGVFNITDDEPAPPQDVVEYAARLLGVPVPPAVPFEDAPLSPMGRSFYGENKRVSNARLKAALDYAFRYPTYREGLDALHAQA